MAFHKRNCSRTSSTKTTTPTDSWESYFDSWSTEDHNIPDVPSPPLAMAEPIIMDDELYSSNALLEAKLNFSQAHELDLRWLDHHFQLYQDQYSPKVVERLGNVTTANKRQAIVMSASSRPREAAPVVYTTHQKRNDRRPAPVRRVPDDVEHTSNGAEWRAAQGETQRSDEATSAGFKTPGTLQSLATEVRQQTRLPIRTFFTTTAAAQAHEARRKQLQVRVNRKHCKGPSTAESESCRSVDPPEVSS
jgi:hypothetical protein